MQTFDVVKSLVKRFEKTLLHRLFMVGFIALSLSFAIILAMESAFFSAGEIRRVETKKAAPSQEVVQLEGTAQYVDRCLEKEEGATDSYPCQKAKEHYARIGVTKTAFDTEVVTRGSHYQAMKINVNWEIKRLQAAMNFIRARAWHEVLDELIAPWQLSLWMIMLIIFLILAFYGRKNRDGLTV